MSDPELSTFISATAMAAEVTTLNAACRRSDGAEPFNEDTMLSLAERSGGALRGSEGELLALALVRQDGDDAHELELAVSPDVRGRGHGRQLAETFLKDAEEAGITARAWAHGDGAPARGLAESLGMREERLLLKLAARLDPAIHGSPQDSPRIRAFTMDRLDEVLRVNRRAFADHPEQGSLNRDGFLARTRESWWWPERLLLALSEDDRVLGFHWLKVTENEAEVYVLAVDPEAAGRGIGRALMHAGLARLVEEGHEEVVLYVDGGNTTAVKLYRSLGFDEAHRDIRWEQPPSAADPRSFTEA